MLLKLMEPTSEDILDNDARACHRILDDVQEATLVVNDTTGENMLHVLYRVSHSGNTTETFVLNANAYLLNDTGKTIQSYGKYVPPVGMTPRPEVEYEDGKVYGAAELVADRKPDNWLTTGSDTRLVQRPSPGITEPGKSEYALQRRWCGYFSGTPVPTFMFEWRDEPVVILDRMGNQVQALTRAQA